MSWSFNSCGKKCDVAALVLADKDIPTALQVAIVELIDGSGSAPDSIRIEASGHGAGLSLRMEEFYAAVAPAPADAASARQTAPPS